MIKAKNVYFVDLFLLLIAYFFCSWGLLLILVGMHRLLVSGFRFPKKYYGIYVGLYVASLFVFYSFVGDYQYIFYCDYYDKRLPALLFLAFLRILNLLFVMKTKDPHGCFGKRYYFGKL